MLLKIPISSTGNKTKFVPCYALIDLSQARAVLPAKDLKRQVAVVIEAVELLPLGSRSEVQTTKLVSRGGRGGGGSLVWI